jgi:hypothetical protein
MLSLGSQVSSLRMPRKCHICKEGQRRDEKGQRRSFLTIFNYLAFLRPAADLNGSVFPWLVRQGRSYEVLWAGSIFRLFEEVQFNCGFLARKRCQGVFDVHLARIV